MLVILAAFSLVALALVFWGVAQAPVILPREDNPRLFEEEFRIRRGRILDANQEILADMTGPPNRLRRIYPIPDIGPAVGYHSIRHGTAGIEEGYDVVLRGQSDDFWEDFWRQNLHRPQVGRDVRLTLNAHWQQRANALLAGQSGALLLLSLPDPVHGTNESAILALASHPTYDPNDLDAHFDDLVADTGAPLLNRVTQGRYQPGLVLQPFLLAAALEQNAIRLTDQVEAAAAEVTFNDSILNCLAEPPEPANWIDVLQNACPGPMLPLAAELGAEWLQEGLIAFGLTTAPNIPLATTLPPERVIDDFVLAAVGQDVLTATPLQVGMAWVALANRGQLPQPRLVAAVQSETGQWQVEPPKEQLGAAVSEVAARNVLDALSQPDNRIEFTTLVVAGPEGSLNGWYLGLAPAANPRYAVVVVIEGSTDVFEARRVGRALLTAVLVQSEDHSILSSKSSRGALLSTAVLTSVVNLSLWAPEVKDGDVSLAGDSTR